MFVSSYGKGQWIACGRVIKRADRWLVRTVEVMIQFTWEGDSFLFFTNSFYLFSFFCLCVIFFTEVTIKQLKEKVRQAEESLEVIVQVRSRSCLIGENTFTRTCIDVVIRIWLSSFFLLFSNYYYCLLSLVDCLISHSIYFFSFSRTFCVRSAAPGRGKQTNQTSFSFHFFFLFRLCVLTITFF